MNKCFNCGEDIYDEDDIYYELAGIAGTIYFCESCGEQFNIPNKRYTIFNDPNRVRHYGTNN